MANLAQMANLGRFGDDKMRFVDGELSHVNSGEASLIDVLGQKGEDIVQDVGSGTINPQTGKKEYWIPIALAAVGAGLSAYSAWSGGRSQSREARHRANLARQGIQDINKAEENLEGVLFSRTDIAGQEWEKDMKDLSSQTGFELKDLRANAEETLRKSGLATSGTANTKESDIWKRISNQFSSNEEGLFANLGKKMGEITSFYEGEKARLKSEKRKLQAEVSLSDDISRSWYLGKNLFG
tara:strand:- start:11691 stop:12410 length:720 start_codon:yes stop_codon:yes gene_type:complete